MIRVPFFPLFGFNKAILKQKRQKGPTQEASIVPNPSLGVKQPLSFSQFYLNLPKPNFFVGSL